MIYLNMMVIKTKIDVNEHFECIGNKDDTCLASGCVFYLLNKKEFIVCPKFQLKREFTVFKK